MDLKTKMQEFNKRWKVVDSEDYEQSFKKFKIRILNILKDIDKHVTRESISLFCQFYGIEEVWHTQRYGDYSWSTNIIDKLTRENNEVEFYKLLQIIFSLDIVSRADYSGANTYSKNILFKKVQEAINFSNVNLSVSVAKDGEIIFYPKGEELLDRELVNKALDFLDEKSNKHFVDALHQYQIKKYVKSAESLRRSVEEFLRFKLDNNKGLKENISEFQKQLKGNKIDSNIRNIIFQIFNCLDQYFNENSKHKDGDIDDNECEFLIYQTGTLLRYINNIKI